MKKIVAFLLLCAMLVTVLAGCSVDMEDFGSIIPMRLASAQADLDPTKMIYDKDFIKSAGLVYEPLVNVNEKGDIENGVITDWYTEYNNDRDEYFLYLKISNTKWNDGRIFNAYHVVYAWKNILSPENASPAACLLYDIKNAKEVKSGATTLTVDDVCVSAITSTLIEVQFEKAIEPELFLESISSIALVPMRDDVIVKSGWATNPDDIGTNGKFIPKSMDPKGLYRFEFSKFYKLSTEPKKGFNQYVKPYYLISDYSKSVEDAVQDFENNDIYYVGELTKDLYAENESDIVTSDSLQNYSYYFNCSNSVLSDAKVRKALGLALDREQIAEIIGLGTTASKGFVNDLAFGSSMGKSFRKEVGDLYNTTASLDEAKALISEAGSKKGSIALTFRSDREYDKPVAEYVKGVWEELGFKVTLNPLNIEEYEEALYNSDFDVIALDFQGLSTSAYSFLAPFAKEFSGNKINVGVSDSDVTPHVSMFDNEDYNKLIASVLDETTRSARAKKLVEAEKLLVEESPAVALVSYKNYYLASGDLKGLSSSPYGFTVFDNAELKDYKIRNAGYLASLEEEEEETN